LLATARRTAHAARARQLDPVTARITERTLPVLVASPSMTATAATADVRRGPAAGRLECF